MKKRSRAENASGLVRSRLGLALVSVVLPIAACSDPAPATEGADGGDAGVASDGQVIGGDGASSDATTTSDGAPTCKCGDPGCCPGVPVEGCCPGATCPIAHDTGMGASYWYCGPLGTPGEPSTYNKDMAERAARAWRPDGSLAEICSGAAIANQKVGASPRWGIWVFAGAAAGHVTSATDPICPAASSSMTWD